MNPKDFFEITHYSLIEVPHIPPFKNNLLTFNKSTYTILSAQANKPHSLSKQTNDPIYFINDNHLYQIGKKEIQQGKTYVGYSVQYLTLIKYKGLYEMDSITIETNLESLKKNKTYRQLSQTNYERVKDGQELLIFNESKLEEQDEYSLSYVLSYKIQNSAQLVQEQFRLEKKQQHTFKAFQPFESHYSMVSENFPEVYLEYQCLNVSSQPLEMKNIEFKVENIMKIEKLQDYELPVVLAQEECLKIIYKIIIDTQDQKAIYTVLTQKKDLIEYDLRLGQIHLEWGTCGNYYGTQKTCLARIYPINLRPVQSIQFERETITTIEIDIELGILNDIKDIDLTIRLDETEMKSIKIVGLSQMKLNYRDGIRAKRVKLDVIAFYCGVQIIKGIKIYDSRSMKNFPYKNFLSVFVVNPQPQQTVADVQQVNLLDLEDLQPQKQIQHENLLDLI